jgi:hypothetical protein
LGGIYITDTIEEEAPAGLDEPIHTTDAPGPSVEVPADVPNPSADVADLEEVPDDGDDGLEDGEGEEEGNDEGGEGEEGGGEGVDEAGEQDVEVVSRSDNPEPDYESDTSPEERERIREAESSLLVSGAVDTSYLQDGFEPVKPFLKDCVSLW